MKSGRMPCGGEHRTDARRFGGFGRSRWWFVAPLPGYGAIGRVGSGSAELDDGDLGSRGLEAEPAEQTRGHRGGCCVYRGDTGLGTPDEGRAHEPLPRARPAVSGVDEERVDHRHRPRAEARGRQGEAHVENEAAQRAAIELLGDPGRAVLPVAEPEVGVPVDEPLLPGAPLFTGTL